MLNMMPDSAIIERLRNDRERDAALHGEGGRA